MLDTKQSFETIIRNSNETDLVEANRIILSALSLRRKLSARLTMHNFGIGDRVIVNVPPMSNDKGINGKTGIVTKKNQKTCTVVLEETKRIWRIPPDWLQSA